MTKRTIEVFSAGCGACDDALELINSLTCGSCDVTVLDMRQPDVAARARQLGVRSVPAVVVDGQLADCCTGRGIDADTLRSLGVGSP